MGRDINNHLVPVGTHYHYQQEKIKQLIEYSFADTYFEGNRDIRMKTYFFDNDQNIEKITLVEYCTDCDRIPIAVWRMDNQGQLQKDPHAIEITQEQEQPEPWWELEKQC